MDIQECSLEAALGVIVFGPQTRNVEGLGYTIDMLRRAASMLEHRYAEIRKFSQQAAEKAAAATQQAPAAPPRKRNRGRPAKASNGAAHEAPTPPAAEPLFQTVGGTPVPAP